MRWGLLLTSAGPSAHVPVPPQRCLSCGRQCRNGTAQPLISGDLGKVPGPQFPSIKGGTGGGDDWLRLKPRRGVGWGLALGPRHHHPEKQKPENGDTLAPHTPDRPQPRPRSVALGAGEDRQPPALEQAPGVPQSRGSPGADAYRGLPARLSPTVPSTRGRGAGGCPFCASGLGSRKRRAAHPCPNTDQTGAVAACTLLRGPIPLPKTR